MIFGDVTVTFDVNGSYAVLATERRTQKMVTLHKNGSLHDTKVTF